MLKRMIALSAVPARIVHSLVLVDVDAQRLRETAKDGNGATPVRFARCDGVAPWLVEYDGRREGSEYSGAGGSRPVLGLPGALNLPEAERAPLVPSEPPPAPQRPCTPLRRRPLPPLRGGVHHGTIVLSIALKALSCGGRGRLDLPVTRAGSATAPGWRRKGACRDYQAT